MPQRQLRGRGQQGPGIHGVGLGKQSGGGSPLEGGGSPLEGGGCPLQGKICRGARLDTKQEREEGSSLELRRGEEGADFLQGTNPF